MSTIELQKEYGYVLASATSTLFLAIWLGARVGTYRKAAKIPYPYEYASYEQVSSAPADRAHAMHLFNSAQRAHQNYNENHPSALAAMLIMGARYPVAAAGLGAVWAAGRTVYALGYTDGQKDGKGRYKGIWWVLAHFGLLGGAAKVAWDLVMA